MNWLWYALGGFILGLGVMAYFTVWAFRDRIHTGIKGFVYGSGKPNPNGKEREVA